MSDDSLLPINSSLLERGLEHAWKVLLDHLNHQCCQNHEDQTCYLFPNLMNPCKTPAEFLPYLAVDRGVSEWQSSDGEKRKRAAVALAWPIKRLGGTRASLIYAIESMGYSAEVTPWYALTPKGAPYSFNAAARATAGFNQSDFNRLTLRLSEAKAERDTLQLNISAEVRGQVRTAFYSSSGVYVNVYPQPALSTAVAAHVFGRGVSLSRATQTRVFPHQARSRASTVQMHLAILMMSPATATAIYPLSSGSMTEVPRVSVDISPYST